MTRVWLDSTEWDCCADPFTLSDEVDFVVHRRTPSDEFVRDLGAELAATVGAFERRHPPATTNDRVQGRVTRIQIVLQDTVTRSSPRHPGYGAPRDDVNFVDVGLPPSSRGDRGGAVFLGLRPSRWMSVSKPVPHAVERFPPMRFRVSGTSRMVRSPLTAPTGPSPVNSGCACAEGGSSTSTRRNARASRQRVPSHTRHPSTPPPCSGCRDGAPACRSPRATCRARHGYGRRRWGRRIPPPTS